MHPGALVLWCSPLPPPSCICVYLYISVFIPVYICVYLVYICVNPTIYLCLSLMYLASCILHFASLVPWCPGALVLWCSPLPPPSCICVYLYISAFIPVYICVYLVYICVNPCLVSCILHLVSCIVPRLLCIILSTLVFFLYLVASIISLTSPLNYVILYSGGDINVRIFSSCIN